MCPARWPQRDPKSCKHTCHSTSSVLICSWSISYSVGVGFCAIEYQAHPIADLLQGLRHHRTKPSICEMHISSSIQLLACKWDTVDWTRSL